jgi:hypothetical protein
MQIYTEIKAHRGDAERSHKFCLSLLCLRLSAVKFVMCLPYPLLEQLGGKLVQVVTPVDPGMAAGGLLVDRRKAVLFEHIH